MSNVHTVFEFLKENLMEIKDLAESEVLLTTSIDELGLDSLDYVEIQVGVKRQFGVTLSPSLFEREITTLGQLCEYVAKAETASEAAQ